ncbi:hypothetical protein [Bacillus solimangrovi]|uniref:DUF4030 domain-containing protein n=1 Tax=Bacillus solimangrovi TaxID=1305675 RepID=A0A1E5LEF8_9BACI|nr:hypothetical protein [Bacillus solimangrovi]OEH92468.1 hypothetical protein BFG57_15885 [Bacillus solimangrovi]
MKKVVIGIVLIVFIFGSALAFLSNSDGLNIAKSDKQIESEIVKSMEETKNENENIEKLFTRSLKELKDKGFEEIGLSYSHEERILFAQVNDTDTLEDNKGEIKEILVRIAKEVGINGFNIKFGIVDKDNTRNQEDKKLIESMHKVSNVVSDVLKDNNYSNLSYSISINPNDEIIVIRTDVDFGGNGELEKLISNSILSKTNMNYKVEIKKRSDSELREQEWQPIFAAIRDETSKKFNEYRGFAHSFHPQPLQIIIKTKINDSWFTNSEIKVKEIENYVDKIIELKIEALSIKEIPYEIIIREKNNKKIN